MPVCKLLNPVQNYGWGSTEFIPRLLGQTPDPSTPVAELWLGAHPQAPSQVGLNGGSLALSEFIAQAPDARLGRAAALYRGRIPFLCKVLAAAQPLSLQAHPDKRQAEAGFARENGLGLPPDAPTRNYKDDNHKPELICALTPFDALCGFRPYPEMIRNLRVLSLQDLCGGWDAFARQPDQQSLRTLLLQLWSLDAPGRERLLGRLKDVLHGSGELTEDLGELCKLLAGRYPDDVGVLAPLYLNVFRLQPGQALYLRPGTLHSYIQGAGIEIMANSDNVLRGGLTPKHIDAAELAQILDFSPVSDSLINPRQVTQQISAYACPADEFQLLRVELTDPRLELDTRQAPVIALCTQGSASLRSSGTVLDLVQGAAAFITADTGCYSLQGEAQLWLATLP